MDYVFSSQSFPGNITLSSIWEPKLNLLNFCSKQSPGIHGAVSNDCFDCGALTCDDEFADRVDTITFLGLGKRSEEEGIGLGKRSEEEDMGLGKRSEEEDIGFGKRSEGDGIGLEKHSEKENFGICKQSEELDFSSQGGKPFDSAIASAKHTEPEIDQAKISPNSSSPILNNFFQTDHDFFFSNDSIMYEFQNINNRSDNVPNSVPKKAAQGPINIWESCEFHQPESSRFSTNFDESRFRNSSTSATNRLSWLSVLHGSNQQDFANDFANGENV